MASREQKNARQRELRAKERKEKCVARVQGQQDSTKIMILSENQLLNLYEQMVGYENNHGLGDEWSKFYCYECSEISFRPKGVNGYGMYNPLHIQIKKLKPDPHDNPAILRVDGFPCGSVALAAHGIFASHPKDHVSHLCDNARCVRPEHIIWESCSKNNGRKGCPGWIKCNCCDTMHDVCIHEPKCIKVTTRK